MLGLGLVLWTRGAPVILVCLFSFAAWPAVVADDPTPSMSLHTSDGYLTMSAMVEVAPEPFGCVSMDGVPFARTCNGVQTGSAVEFVVPVAPGVESIVFELDWEATLPITSLLFEAFCDDVPRGVGGSVLDREHPCFHEVTGSGPLRVRVDAPGWSGGAYDPVGDWSTRVFGDAGSPGASETGIGIGAAWDQPYRVYVSVFYHAPAPDGYTAIP